MSKISYARHRFPPSIIQRAVWLYFRFPLSFRDVEELLAERGIEVSYETIRRWILKFGREIAAMGPDYCYGETDRLTSMLQICKFRSWALILSCQSSLSVSGPCIRRSRIGMKSIDRATIRTRGGLHFLILPVQVPGEAVSRTSQYQNRRATTALGLCHVGV